MDKGVRNTLLWIAAFIATMLGLLFANYMTPRGPSAEELKTLGFYTYDSPRTIESFELIDHNGNKVGTDLFADKWSFVFFGFTYCPDICPTTMAQMNQAVAKMANPPQVVMVSVDPERDSPEALAEYVPSFNPAFIGVTGEFDQIVRLATQVNAAFGKVPGEDPSTYLVDHTASIVVIDPEGRYAGFIKAPHNVENMVTIAATLR